MRITERKLLATYRGITNGAYYLSDVDGQTVCWIYRQDNGAVTHGRDDAHHISLEDDRRGVVVLNTRLGPEHVHAVAELEADAQRLWGDRA